MAMNGYRINDDSLRRTVNLSEALLDGFITQEEFVGKLDSDFREAIYREQRHRYLLEDAVRAWREHSDFYLAGHPYRPVESDYELLVERFEDGYDANVDENYQWEYHVEQFCIEVQGDRSAA